MEIFEMGVDDSDEPDSCDLCGGDMTEDMTVFWCDYCGACICSSDCAGAHLEEEHDIEPREWPEFDSSEGV